MKQLDQNQAAASRLPKLLTDQQAADYLRVSIYTVHRLRKLGRIGHCKVGRKARYTEDHLLNFLAEVNQECPAMNEASTGYPSAQDHKTGAELGMTATPDKQDVHRLAQEIVGKLS